MCGKHSKELKEGVDLKGPIKGERLGPEVNL